jgi:hypothetical protein
MGRPSKSKFMGRAYSVAFVPQGSIQAGDLWGETDHSLQLIRVEDGLHPDKERAIVLHEALHQVLSLSGADLPEKVEEQVCTLLGEAMIGHMRDNPTFWRYLMQRPAAHSSRQ